MVTDAVLAYLEQNFAERISLRDVAITFGYSNSHFTTRFREATGSPVTMWIVKRRIIAAQALLREGVKVAAVCEAVGFNDLNYFRRQFQRYVGVTPGRFRSARPQAPS
jgi:AraC-like DNA-binding protein